MDYLIEKSDFIDSGSHVDTLSWLSLQNEDDNKLLKDIIFTIVLPDAIIGGKMGTLCARYYLEGYVPIYTQLILDASERHFEELYIFNHAKTDLGGTWWLNRRIYQTSPVVLLVLKKVSPSLTTSHSDFRKLKGPSSPYVAQKGQIRHDYEAVNRCLSLIHSSDEPLSTVRELKIFGGEKAFRNMIENARMCLSPDGQASVYAGCMETVEKYTNALQAFQSETDFLRILYGIKHRVLAKLEDTNASKTIDIHLKKEGQNLFSKLNLVERTLLFVKDSNIDFLPCVRTNDATQLEIIKALKLMFDFQNFSANTSIAIMKSVTYADIPITNWESTVLLTSMHYWKEFELIMNDDTNRNKV